MLYILRSTDFILGLFVRRQNILHMRWFSLLGKHSFVAWIIYQAIKGTLTTAFIWLPLLYYYFTDNFYFAVWFYSEWILIEFIVCLDAHFKDTIGFRSCNT